MSKFSQVQKQQKQLPYTVTPIGDEVALKAWKEYRAQKDLAYKTEAAVRFEKTKEVAVSMIINQDVNPFKFTPAEQEEIKARHKRLAALKKGIDVVRRECSDPSPEMAPPLLQRIKSFFNFR